MGNREALVAIAAVFMVIPIIAVAMRMSSRRMQRAGFAADDLVIVFALFFAVMMCVCVIIGATLGSEGEHLHMTPLGEKLFVIDLKTEYFLQIQTAVASGLTKISLLLLYRRIFPGRTFKWITFVFGAIIVAWMVAFFFKNILQCVPAYLFWAPPSRQKGHCINSVPSYLAYAITDLVTDIMILSLPAPQVLRLNMPLGRRLAVSGIFLLGTFVVAVGAVRLAYFFIVGREYAHSNDVPYYNPPTEYWDLIETSTGVVCACLPVLRPVLAHLSPRQMLRSLQSALSLQTLRRSSPGQTTTQRSPPRNDSDASDAGFGGRGVPMERIGREKGAEEMVVLGVGGADDPESGRASSRM